MRLAFSVPLRSLVDLLAPLPPRSGDCYFRLPELDNYEQDNTEPGSNRRARVNNYGKKRQLRVLVPGEKGHTRKGGE